MGKTRDIFEKLSADLSAYINDDEVLYELYRELPEDLEPRQGIAFARIAMYAQGEDEIIKVDSGWPADSTQRISVDISVVRGYRGDDSSFGELPAVDLKDKIIEWIKQVEPYTVTVGAISSLTYDGSTGFTRRSRFVTMTMNFSGLRDLIQDQDPS